MYPCSCTVSAPLYIGAVKFGTINCPAGLTAAETKKALSSIPAGFNIQAVTLNLRRGTNTANAVGSRFPLNYPQATITISNLNDGNTCVDSSLLAPCTCQSGIITCPSNIAAGSIVPGTAVDQIKAIFNRISTNTNLGDVVLNFPAGDVAIPANMLGSNSANTIQIISDAGTNNSKLRVLLKFFFLHELMCLNSIYISSRSMLQLSVHQLPQLPNSGLSTLMWSTLIILS